MNDTPDTLRELIDRAFQRHSVSGRQLGLLAQKHGFRIVSTTINHIRNGTYKATPSPETLRAIAWLAGVPEEVAFTAAGQTVPGPPLGEELPPGADNLPPKARKAVIEYTRVLIDQQEQIRELTKQLEQAAGPVSERSGGGASDGEDARPGQKSVPTTVVPRFGPRPTVDVEVTTVDVGREEVAPVAGSSEARRRSGGKDRGADER